MSDVIAGLKQDLEQRLQEIERELAAYAPLMREREQIEAALAGAPASVRDHVRWLPIGEPTAVDV